MALDARVSIDARTTEGQLLQLRAVAECVDNGVSGAKGRESRRIVATAQAAGERRWREPAGRLRRASAHHDGLDSGTPLAWRTGQAFDS